MNKILFQSRLFSFNFNSIRRSILFIWEYSLLACYTVLYGNGVVPELHPKKAYLGMMEAWLGSIVDIWRSMCSYATYYSGKLRPIDVSSIWQH